MCWWGTTTVARFFRRLPNLDNCLSRAGTRRGSQRSVFEIVVVIEGRAGACRLRRRWTLQELRRVAVVRLARFARRALGRIAADLRLQLYDVEEDVGLAAQLRGNHRRLRRDGRGHRDTDAASLHRPPHPPGGPP